MTDATAVVGGLAIAGMGAFVVRYPMRLRSVASARTWREDPERAERHQRALAYVFGVFLVGIGLATVALGVASG